MTRAGLDGLTADEVHELAELQAAIRAEFATLEEAIAAWEPSPCPA